MIRYNSRADVRVDSTLHLSDRNPFQSTHTWNLYWLEEVALCSESEREKNRKQKMHMYRIISNSSIHLIWMYMRMENNNFMRFSYYTSVDCSHGLANKLVWWTLSHSYPLQSNHSSHFSHESPKYIPYHTLAHPSWNGTAQMASNWGKRTKQIEIENNEIGIQIQRLLFSILFFLLIFVLAMQLRKTKCTLLTFLTKEMCTNL